MANKIVVVIAIITSLRLVYLI